MRKYRAGKKIRGRKRNQVEERQDPGQESSDGDISKKKRGEKKLGEAGRLFARKLRRGGLSVCVHERPKKILKEENGSFKKG